MRFEVIFEMWTNIRHMMTKLKWFYVKFEFFKKPDGVDVPAILAVVLEVLEWSGDDDGPSPLVESSDEEPLEGPESLEKLFSQISRGVSLGSDLVSQRKTPSHKILNRTRTQIWQQH